MQVSRSGQSAPLVAVLCIAALCLHFGPAAFVGVARSPSKPRSSALSAEPNRVQEQQYYDSRDPLPEGYGIRTGLSDLLKPLNSESGVVAKEESIPTYIVLVTGVVLLFLFYLFLLLINNQSVLLPPEDEFDEYVANFLPYFFFGEK